MRLWGLGHLEEGDSFDGAAGFRASGGGGRLLWVGVSARWWRGVQGGGIFFWMGQVVVAWAVRVQGGGVWGLWRARR